MLQAPEKTSGKSNAEDSPPSNTGSQGRMLSKAEEVVGAEECRAASLLGQRPIISSKWGQRRYIGLC